ncbi:MAG: PRC-barrel domain-containing protein [Candidatus Methanospirareceae archaeon]
MQMELSSLYGMSIYTDTGVYVGKVDDVSIDIKEGRIAGLLVKNVNPNAFNIKGKKGVIIPYRWVTSIGEVVIIKHITKVIGAAEEKEGRSEG